MRSTVTTNWSAEDLAPREKLLPILHVLQHYEWYRACHHASLNAFDGEYCSEMDNLEWSDCPPVMASAIKKNLESSALCRSCVSCLPGYCIFGVSDITDDSFIRKCLLKEQYPCDLAKTPSRNVQLMHETMFPILGQCLRWNGRKFAVQMCTSTMQEVHPCKLLFYCSGIRT